MSFRLSSILAFAGALAWASTAFADEAPTLRITWPTEGAALTLGADAEKAIGVVVQSSFVLKAAGQCGDNPRCGHLHMKIDPQGDTCNQPGTPSNSMNSDHGGELIKARFGFCQSPAGTHVIGILLANDRHQPVLVGGKPVIATVTVTTREAATGSGHQGTVPLTPPVAAK